MSQVIMSHREIFVRQVHELAELIGFETRNKYQIFSKDGSRLAHAAEEKRGLFGFLFTQMLGHWRSFTIHFYDNNNTPFLLAHHPFRFFFQRLEIKTPDGNVIGALQQRWSFTGKKFDVEDARANVTMQVYSPFWRLWSFPFYGVQTRSGQQLGLVAKKWSGIFTEMITDKDNFLVEFGPDMNLHERYLLMASAIFIDLQYFERKAGK